MFDAHEVMRSDSMRLASLLAGGISVPYANNAVLRYYVKSGLRKISPVGRTAEANNPIPGGHEATFPF